MDPSTSGATVPLKVEETTNVRHWSPLMFHFAERKRPNSSSSPIGGDLRRSRSPIDSSLKRDDAYLEWIRQAASDDGYRTGPRRFLDPEALVNEGLHIFRRPDKKTRFVRCEVCRRFPRMVRKFNYRNRLPPIASEEGTEYRNPILLEHIAHPCHREALEYNRSIGDACLTQLPIVFPKLVPSAGSDPGHTESISLLEDPGHDLTANPNPAALAQSQEDELQLSRSLLPLAVAHIKQALPMHAWPSLVLWPVVMSTDVPPNEVKARRRWATVRGLVELAECLSAAYREEILDVMGTAVATALHVIGPLSPRAPSMYHLILRGVAEDGSTQTMFLDLCRIRPQHPTDVQQIIDKSCSTQTIVHSGCCDLRLTDDQEQLLVVTEKGHLIHKIWPWLLANFPVVATFLHDLRCLSDQLGQSQDPSNFPLETLFKWNSCDSRLTHYGSCLEAALVSVLSSWTPIHQQLTSLAEVSVSQTWRGVGHLRFSSFLADLAHLLSRAQARVTAGTTSVVEMAARREALCIQLNSMLQRTQLGGWEEEFSRVYQPSTNTILSQPLLDDQFDYQTKRSQVLQGCIDYLTQAQVNCLGNLAPLLPGQLSGGVTDDSLRSAHASLPYQDWGCQLRDLADACREAIHVIARGDSLEQAITALHKADPQLFAPLVGIYAKLLAATPPTGILDRLVHCHIYWERVLSDGSLHSLSDELVDQLMTNWFQVTFNCPAPVEVHVTDACLKAMHKRYSLSMSTDGECEAAVDELESPICANRQWPQEANGRPEFSRIVRIH